MTKMNFRESSRFHFQPILHSFPAELQNLQRKKKLFFETGFYFKRKKQPVLRWFPVFALNFTKLEHHILIWKALLFNSTSPCTQELSREVWFFAYDSSGCRNPWKFLPLSVEFEEQTGSPLNLSLTQQKNTHYPGVRLASSQAFVYSPKRLAYMAYHTKI